MLLTGKTSLEAQFTASDPTPFEKLLDEVNAITWWSTNFFSSYPLLSRELQRGQRLVVDLHMNALVNVLHIFMGASRQVSRIRGARWRSSVIGSSLNRRPAWLSGKTPPDMHSVQHRPR